MKERLERTIRKNWMVGTLATGTFVLTGSYRVAIFLGLGTLVWNLILYGVIIYVGQKSKDTGIPK